MKRPLIFILLFIGLYVFATHDNQDLKREEAIKKARTELLKEFEGTYDTPKRTIENEFSLFHQSNDRFYWSNYNDSVSVYIPMKTPLMLSDKWEEIIAPYKGGDTFSAFPFQHDKDFSCNYHLIDNRLLLTFVLTYFEDDCKETVIHRLDSLLPEKFTHEYDEFLKSHHISVSPHGAMLITWVDSLDVRNFQTYKQHRPGETSDGFFNRLDVHPYLRLYFKEGVLTNIKFITPRVKEE